MVDASRFKRKTFFKIKNVFRIAFDILIFLLLLIPFLFQWIFRMLFRKKKCIKGKTVLVTGGGNGLGKAIFLALASRGCNVIISDIDEDAAKTTSREIINKGLKSMAYKTDITSTEDILFLKEEIIKNFGGLDILVNNAGIISASNLGTDSQLEAMVKVNLFGPILITKHFLEHMKERKSGHIVSISSMAGLQPSPYIMAYTATKFGVTGFMAALNEHLRLEKLGDYIKTTCVFPYYINTRQLVTDFLDTNIRIPPLEVGYTANEVVEGILREDHVTTIPRYLELTKLIQCLPLRIQQFFNDRVKREYGMKNPNFREDVY